MCFLSRFLGILSKCLPLAGHEFPCSFPLCCFTAAGICLCCVAVCIFAVTLFAVTGKKNMADNRTRKKMHIYNGDIGQCKLWIGTIRQSRRTTGAKMGFPHKIGWQFLIFFYSHHADEWNNEEKKDRKRDEHNNNEEKMWSARAYNKDI